MLHGLERDVTAWRDNAVTTASTSAALDLLLNIKQMAEAIDHVFALYSVDPFCLVYSSPSAQRLYGFDLMTHAGDTSERHAVRMASYVHPEDLQAYADLLVDLPFTSREREYRIIDSEGQVRWLRSRVCPIRDEHGSVFRVAAVTEDISDRKRADRELELHRATDRLMHDVSREFTAITRERLDQGFTNALRDIAMLLGAGCAAISLLDDAGTMLRLKWRWAGSEFGLTPFPEIPFAPGCMERTLLERLGIAQVGSVPDLPDMFAERRDRLLQSGFRSMVNVGLFARDRLIGVLGFGSAVEVNTWPPELHALIELAGQLFSNVIERLRSEADTRTHRDQLAHVLRLGTMGQLAAGIAHELNQPLSAIVSFARGCVHRLSEGGIEPKQLSDALEKITGQALRAAAIIRTLRELVRASSHLSRESVTDLLENVARLIEPEFVAADIRLRVDADPDLPSVQIDRIQIEQVLLNLLKNAYDALASVPPHHTREARVEARRSEQGAIDIAVSDTGPGIDPAHAMMIFQDFHTSKPDGLGLGLSISRSIVEAHGGRLWLDASPEGGACFRFTLPLARPAIG